MTWKRTHHHKVLCTTRNTKFIQIQMELDFWSCLVRKRHNSLDHWPYHIGTVYGYVIVCPSPLHPTKDSFVWFYEICLFDIAVVVVVNGMENEFWEQQSMAVSPWPSHKLSVGRQHFRAKVTLFVIHLKVNNSSIKTCRFFISGTHFPFASLFYWTICYIFRSPATAISCKSLIESQILKQWLLPFGNITCCCSFNNLLLEICELIPRSWGWLVIIPSNGVKRAVAFVYCINNSIDCDCYCIFCKSSFKFNDFV